MNASVTGTWTSAAVVVLLVLLYSACGPSAASTQPAQGPIDSGTPAMRPGTTPLPGQTGDPSFLGPFCEGDFIVGFDKTAGEAKPPPQVVRAFALAAVNHIRARTGLRPYLADAALDDIADRALDAVATLGVHGYFQANCMNKEHDYGRNCEAKWAQENYGSASGSRRTWKDGIRVPLCGMMEEPKGQGHRGNIESPKFTRMGSSANGVKPNGASWNHEFGW